VQQPVDSGEEFPPPRVLVVDDVPELRRSIGRSLTRSGYDVAFAADGRQALDTLAAEGGVDAVTTDVDMPVMSGPELAGEVLHHHPGVPVLFVSSSPVPARFLDHPLVDRLCKPPAAGALRARVGRLLRAAAAHSTAGRRPRPNANPTPAAATRTGPS